MTTFTGRTERQRMMRQEVSVELVERKMPTPDSLLAEALTIPQRPRSIQAGDYASVVHELRGRGYTWGDVQEWLAERGLDFSRQAINSAYRKRYGTRV